jgi:hypothetical protein
MAPAAAKKSRRFDQLSTRSINEQSERRYLKNSRSAFAVGSGRSIGGA